MKALEQFQPAASQPMQAAPTSTTQKAAEMDQPLRPTESPLKGVRSNIVQSIRAFHVHDLQLAAAQLGQHFLYANLATAQSKQDVLDLIAEQFTFPTHAKFDKEAREQLLDIFRDAADYWGDRKIPFRCFYSFP